MKVAFYLPFLVLFCLCGNLYAQQNFYFGYRLNDVMSSGRDLLGEKALADGEPDFEQVAKILPPITGAYSYLSGAASWGNVIVDDFGNIASETVGNKFFSPVSVDSVLAREKPRQWLMDGCFPVLFSQFAKGDRTMELLYFVEAGDPGRDPLTWIRVRTTNGAQTDEQYRVVSAWRPKPREVSAENYQDALQTTVEYWKDFRSRTASFVIPQERLANVAHGSMIFMAAGFSGGAPHYGHEGGYYKNIHDNFPPNYIWAIEASCVAGRFDLARQYTEHLLRYGTDIRGRFNYRQGDDEIRSSSAVEYSQILFLLHRYAKVLRLKDWGGDYLRKMTGMADELLAHLVAVPEAGGAKLIRMCAEADTNGREYVYFNNNLWTVRGLRALADLLSLFGESAKAANYRKTADELLVAVRKVMDAHTVENAFGSVVPFRLGYTATPLTLSACDSLLLHLPQQQRETYKQITWVRDKNEREQDLTENTYANYRYYPEMFSSMLLSEKQTAALVRMRETLGGELLGMTRLWSVIDDWPVVNYARFLIESGRIDKYLLLLYAHTLHHGLPDKICYFEQIRPDGAANVPDCTPSLLTTPVMTAWMFAYEPVETKQLQLFRAVPKAWFAKDFSVQGVGFSGGKVSLQSKNDASSVTLSGEIVGDASDRQILLYTRFTDNLKKEDILEGNKFIDKIFPDHIRLKSGVGKFHLKIFLTN